MNPTPSQTESPPGPMSLWDRPLKYAHYLNEKQIQALQKGLDIYTIGDLFRHFPFRYEDRSQILRVKDLHLGMSQAQIKGSFATLVVLGEGKSRRLSGTFFDETGSIEIVWFQKLEAIKKIIKTGVPYLVWGKMNHFNGRPGYTHPEIEPFVADAKRNALEPVYATSETMKRLGLDSKMLGRLLQWNLKKFQSELAEPFPPAFVQEQNLMPLPRALWQIHQPESAAHLEKAQERIKIEELFPMQFFLLRKKHLNQESKQGFYMPRLQDFTRFYGRGLPFPLTNAQKRVLKEIRQDLISGSQMNRLVQGDVGSGKTIVAFLSMLMAHDNGFQSCMMAPTEILAQQHYESISKLAQVLDLEVGLLTGSSKKSERKELAAKLEDGRLRILIGTHAILEDPVTFHNLGLCVIDEQHRFGVAQRARLHAKNKDSFPPHILVMSATPIPRTLAMALYSDLDVSRIDEMPVGRKEIMTVHRTESKRMTVFGFIREQIREGRQAYIVYPMIEESEQLDLNNLMEGFQSIQHAFPEYHLSMVHGKMKPADKDFEMARFAKGETQIMVATTVIEVGVNVPNASIMLVENAERFGLTQLHQLRGRVGRGEFQSYCILMTGTKVSREGKVRIETLCQTTNGFEIAETDLKLRGPGDLMGTQQSGIADLKLTNLSEDGTLLEKVKQWAEDLVSLDPNLELSENQSLKHHLQEAFRTKTYWNEIS